MQAVFFGLPRSGKTSTKNRLIGKQVEPVQPSTGIAEKVSRIELQEVKKTAVEISADFTWHELSLNDEAAVVVEEISMSDETVRGTPSEYIGAVSGEQDDSDSRHHQANILPKSVQSSEQRLYRHISHADVPQVQANSLSTPSSNQVLKKLEIAIQNAKKKVRDTKHPWTLYLTDAGGQPEFQELLPTLVSGFSVFFIFLRLDQSLKMPCTVEYLNPRDGKSITPFDASYSVKEGLLQCLATAASIKKLSPKYVLPKIVFIGTHKDKVNSEDQIYEIDKELQAAVKKTFAYESDMIEFASADRLIFPVNNLSSTSEDIQEVRKVVERIGSRNKEYVITTPYNWMLFSIILRQHKCAVISFKVCMEIAKVCGISTENESDIREALSFFHHIGIIRYFDELKPLRDVVILDPQYIFDKLTELIVDTFTFERTVQSVSDNFKKKGIFPVDAIENLSSDGKGLNKDQFMALLEHFHVIAPIKRGGETIQYFAPCALSHCEITPPFHLQSDLPPILVTFKGGFCPKGMFGFLVVELLKKQDIRFQWHFLQDQIYRNRICFHIGPYNDVFEFFSFPTHIRIQCKENNTLKRSISIAELCCHVQKDFEKICASTMTAFGMDRSAVSLGFYCTLHNDPDPHPAVINFDDGKPCTLCCCEKNECYNLSSKQLIWFNKVSGNY